MSLKPQFQQSPPALPEFRKRLQIITAAMILAQFSYCLVGYFVILGLNRPTPPRDANQLAVTAVVTVLGIASLAASFFIAKLNVPQQTATPPAPSPQILLKQLILGAALCEVPSLLGLVLFFLYGQLVILVLFACLASAAIVGHYLRAANRLDSFQIK
jgi:hypothetical protein